ncbi:phage tail protein [Gluconobacter wancherniae]|uniref:Phage tail protein n=1 Tax=Gluconobacter wancherniae NBRC 103581 TaxID=656744 RepID=A0A511AZX9_9PROT|nr:phage tail protein [Gluconobacter wancherniae]MBF0854405.1 phage tail protein [Gluconobacter wancherniae]MBS1062801.1 phage tail protein [Gluconobacter wancherniae]MBS1088463.1 phage tail protein [Gluconobacter wancherniae]MBS1094935.1 phage tail protein [Gluconobacter wancherniae]GBD57466.1 hypothetical protein NBRC103581_02054 [Gluconobacter wancherniae NBRC 103581]
MKSISHVMGEDFPLLSGSLVLIDGAEKTRQRLLRRLLTISGDYIWQNDYGAGLPAMVGQTISTGVIQEIITAQVRQDIGVDAAQPVTVAVVPENSGVCTCTISYVDAESGMRSSLNFSS